MLRRLGRFGGPGWAAVAASDTTKLTTDGDDNIDFTEEEKRKEGLEVDDIMERVR